MVFGRDLTQIPCFRDSTLYGIYSGIATVVLTLMASSRPRLAADTGVGVFCVVTFGSFAFCRHQREKTQNMISVVKDSRKERLASENKMDEA